MEFLSALASEYLASIVAGIVGVSATWILSFFYFRRAILALLHDRIYQACMFYIRRKWISSYDLKNLDYLYRPYHKLHGNDICKELYENRVMKIEVRDEPPEPTKGDM